MEFEIKNDKEDGAFLAIATDDSHKGQLIGEVLYVERPGYLDIFHTGLEPDFEGMGLASKVAQAVLNEVRRTNQKIYVRCPYLENFLRKHDGEYSDILFS